MLTRDKRKNPCLLSKSSQVFVPISYENREGLTYEIITSIWGFWVAKSGERKMRGSNLRKELCHVSPNVSNLSLVLSSLCCSKKEKGRPFILWGPPSPLLCNQGQLMAKSQFKDCNPTTSPPILPWDLSWSSCTSFLLSPSRHNQIQGVIPSSRWRHSQSQRRGPAH
jgi:hypothetical protein